MREPAFLVSFVRAVAGVTSYGSARHVARERLDDLAPGSAALVLEHVAVRGFSGDATARAALPATMGALVDLRLDDTIAGGARAADLSIAAAGAELAVASLLCTETDALRPVARRARLDERPLDRLEVLSLAPFARALVDAELAWSTPAAPTESELLVQDALFAEHGILAPCAYLPLADVPYALAGRVFAARRRHALSRALMQTDAADVRAAIQRALTTTSDVALPLLPAAPVGVVRRIAAFEDHPVARLARLLLARRAGRDAPPPRSLRRADDVRGAPRGTFVALAMRSRPSVHRSAHGPSCAEMRA